MVNDPKQLHIPVLPKEVIEALAPERGGRFLDGTLGMGGHASLALEAARQAGVAMELCGLDRDTEALALAEERLTDFAGQTHFFHLRYSQFEEALQELGWDFLDGALVDIGVSSLQIDKADRGFSFHQDGPLDMRMDQSATSAEKPVSQLVNRARQEELKDIIARYGEEPQAGRIAAAIVRSRQTKPIETTLELAKIVEHAYPPAWRAKARNHPATRTFQALRMAVNDEIGELEQFLKKILSHLNPGGRLVVISFHSLEDRVAKHVMQDWAKGCLCPKHLPVCVCHHVPEVLILTKHPTVAGPDELAVNPRAACAKMRAVEKLPETNAGQVATPSGAVSGFEREPRPTSRRERLRLREAKILRRTGGA